MICPACGKETSSTSNYCIHCGTLVESDTAPTQLLTPEMEQIMFGDKKTGYSEEAQKSTPGNKGYTVVNDGRQNGREAGSGRSDWNSGIDSRAAGNSVGQKIQTGSGGYSGNAYSGGQTISGTGYSGAGREYAGGLAAPGSGYAGAGTGYSSDYTSPAPGYSDGYSGTGAGYSDSYSGTGKSGTEAGSGFTATGDGYTGTRNSIRGGYADANMVSTIDPKYAGMDLTPISVLGYVGYTFLFAVPVVGLIFMIIYSLGSNERVNLKNYARSSLILYIIGFIAVILYYLFVVFYM